MSLQLSATTSVSLSDLFRFATTNVSSVTEYTVLTTPSGDDSVYFYKIKISGSGGSVHSKDCFVKLRTYQKSSKAIRTTLTKSSDNFIGGSDKEFLYGNFWADSSSDVTLEVHFDSGFDCNIDILVELYKV